jgi:predicted enzyme related to lactoylglutathione lyase
MPNPIIHFEIGCRDEAATATFYGAVFDWKLDPAPTATTINTGSEPGGHIDSLGHEPHTYTIFYVGVDDITATLNAAEANGGKRSVGPVEVPGGKFAWMLDPEGNTIGLFQSD